MNKLFVSAIVAAGVAMPALAQYTYEYRIIADGDAGAPTGAWAQQPNTGGTATQVGFWIQARVSQTTGQNWGIGRCTAPGVPNCDFLTVTDSASSTALNRGRINSVGTANYGRGSGYRNGGSGPNASQNSAAGNGGNSTVSPPVTANPVNFPGTTNTENGAFDTGTPGGSGFTRIYGWDAYVGGTRNSPTYLQDPGDPTSTADVIDPNTGNPVNPWGRNGGAGPAGGNPTANPVQPWANGTFSDWANLYRFVVIVTDHSSARNIVLNSSAQLNGTVQAAPSAAGGDQWAMQLSDPFQASASYTLHVVPTPGAATLLGLGGLALARRRRA